MKTIEEQYFDWLCNRIYTPPNKTYIELLRAMFHKRFDWFVPNDDNRVQDGFDLRNEFRHEIGYEDLTPFYPEVMPSSFLEILIGLARRVAFILDEDEAVWAWRLIENIECDRFNDPITLRRLRNLDAKLSAVVQRTYHWDGKGGFFPLHSPEDNQTKVELWKQMNLYVNEMHRF